MKTFFLFAFIFLLSSCADIKVINRQNESQKNHVATGIEESVAKPENETVIIKTNPVSETVRIGNQGGVVFVEQTLGDEATSKTENRRVRIGLALGPGLYRTINYVSLLKKLERQNLTPDVLTGTGMGALVAAMYASGMTPEMIEWNFYKYFKEKRKNKIHENDWIEDIDRHLLSKLKIAKLQETKRKLFLTLYDHNSKKTYFFEKGNIRDLILLNLRLSNNAAKESNGKRYSTAFESEIFNSNLMRHFAVDFTIAVDALGNKFDFDIENEFLLGVYGRAASRVQREKKGFNYTITLPLSQMNLDSVNNHAYYLQKTNEFLQKEIQLVQNKINEKRDELNNLGNDQ